MHFHRMYVGSLIPFQDGKMFFPEMYERVWPWRRKYSLLESGTYGKICEWNRTVWPEIYLKVTLWEVIFWGTVQGARF